MTRIYIDIETIPGQEPWVREIIEEKVTHPGNLKKEETINKWYEEQYPQAVEDALHKTSFDGAMNHIICIGVAVDDDNPVSFSATKPEEEPKVLNDFYDFIRKNTSEDSSFGNAGCTYIGHNIISFDLRVIKQRSIILGIKPEPRIPFNAKPWDNNPFDTMKQWDSFHNVKLDVLARALGVKGKSGIDGSMVYGMWQKKQHDEIAEYCRDDVRMVREVERKMRLMA